MPLDKNTLWCIVPLPNSPLGQFFLLWQGLAFHWCGLGVVKNSSLFQFKIEFILNFWECHKSYPTKLNRQTWKSSRHFLEPKFMGIKVSRSEKMRKRFCTAAEGSAYTFTHFVWTSCQINLLGAVQILCYCAEKIQWLADWRLIRGASLTNFDQFWWIISTLVCRFLTFILSIDTNSNV